MMMFSPNLFAAAGLLLSATTNIHALPSGAQSCPFGQAAPQGFHASGTELSTSLEDGGFTVELDGALVVGETRMLTLSAEGGGVFRGFLVRLEGDGELEPIGTASQIATACGDTPGVTHTGREDKSMIQLFVTPLSAGEMLLDVSVVEFNNGVDGNVYSYTQIAATATEAAAEPTDAPVAMAVPTDAPVAMVVVPEPTEAPVAVVPEVVTEAPVMTAVPEVTEAPAVMIVAPNVTTMVEPNATQVPVVVVNTTTDAPTVAPAVAETDMPVVPEVTATPKEPEVDYNESGASVLSVGLVVATLVSMTALFW